MNLDELINTANDIGEHPDMFHPDYGWLRIDGMLTQAGENYFEDQNDKFKTKPLTGNC